MCYKTKEIANITGINLRTLQFYTEINLVPSDVEDFPRTKGRGKSRRYSGANVIEFSFVRTLTERGFSINLINKVLQRIRLDLKYKNYFSPDLLENNAYIFVIAETKSGHESYVVGPESLKRNNGLLILNDGLKESKFLTIVNLQSLYLQLKKNLK